MNLNYILKNILILISLISLFGAIVYRLYTLNNIGIAISLILVIVIFIIILRLQKINNRKLKKSNLHQKNKISILHILLLTSYFLLLTSSFYILFTHQTTDAIITPWQVVPSYFFIIYGLTTAILIVFIQKQSNNLTILLISLHYFLSFSIAWIIYKIGYGFDPFIHQTTMELIDKTGSVFPKPFYYLGHYSLIVILHKITFIPIVWLDKLLVPILAAIYLPSTLFHALSKWFANNKTNLLLLMIILILPFSFFIVTTPQNFAYLLLLLIILLALTYSTKIDLMIIYLLSFATLVIHPLAGIPALLFTILLSLSRCQKIKIKKLGFLLIFIISIIALPLAFYLFENKTTSIDELPAQQTIISMPKIIIPGQENFILNFIYLYGFNLKIIIGLIIAYRNKKQCQIFFLYLLMAAALLISYLLTKFLPFNFLIDYERSNFPDRILLIAIFFFLPFILITLYTLLDKIIKQNNIIKTSLFTFLIILITSSLYLSYPRYDRYFNSRGFSVSQNDINAVHWIENDAQEDYLVLANQQVSAAALREFGFAKYYQNPLSHDERMGEGLGVREIFYYPIPTGGPLYQYYLDMVYQKPSRETMIKAMDLVNVSQAYFVLNKYWWAFPKILEEAKLETDDWQVSGNGQVYVFRYGR